MANCITNFSLSPRRSTTFTRLCPAGQLALTEVDSCASTDDCPTNSFCQIYDKVCCTTVDGCPVDEPTDLTHCTSVDTCSYGMECSDGDCLPEKVCVCTLNTYLCLNPNQGNTTVPTTSPQPSVLPTSMLSPRLSATVFTRLCPAGQKVDTDAENCDCPANSFCQIY